MIILFGPAGSGKSTQGLKIAEKYGWKWLSVGEVLRNSAKFQDTLNSGDLVDDQEVIKMMSKEIDKADEDGMNVVLDGYPRDIVQAEWVTEHMAEKIEAVIILDVPKEELLRRIKERGREDDTDEAIEKRINIFKENISHILVLMKENDVPIYTVDGVGEMDEVTERISGIIEVAVPEAEAQTIDVNNNDIEKSYGE